MHIKTIPIATTEVREGLRVSGTGVAMGGMVNEEDAPARHEPAVTTSTPRGSPRELEGGGRDVAAYGGQSPQNQHRHEVNKLNVKKSGSSRKQ